VLLETVVADLLDVLLGDDPARPGGHRAVERHEVGEGLVQQEAHPGRTDDLDVADAVFQNLADLRPLEAELHVVGGERIAVVELQAFAQLELVGLAVGARRPRLGQARRHEVTRHRLHQGVVQRVEDPERGEEAAGDLSRVEPRGRQRHVQCVAHLAFGLRGWRGLGLGSGDEAHGEQRGNQERFHCRDPAP
jgi:hypothetical protein